MLVTGCLMLVEDPIFSGDKTKKEFLKIQYPETSIKDLFAIGTTIYRNLT